MKENCYNCILHGNCIVVPKDGFCYAWYPDEDGEYFVYVDRFMIGRSTSRSSSRSRSIKNDRNINGGR